MNSLVFDMEDHKILFPSLPQNGMPANLVRLLSFAYSRQVAFVQWGNSFYTIFPFLFVLHDFSISNGVRQGVIISPHFSHVTWTPWLLVGVKARAYSGNCDLGEVCFIYITPHPPHCLPRLASILPNFKFPKLRLSLFQVFLIFDTLAAPLVHLAPIWHDWR